MQRIARLLFPVLLLAAGCSTPAPRKPGEFAVRPPEPPVATRPPAVVQPAPAPQKSAPPSDSEIDVGGLRLNPADWRPPGGIHSGLWKVIVVHHSAAPNSTPQGMDTYHRKERHWENGLGYHFVIGNGVNYPDGKIYVGDRWRGQTQGAHCRTGAGRFFGVPRPSGFFNDHGIGICLIGDFERGRPTAKQLIALRELVRFLTREVGIPASQVYGHGEVTHKTQCPGDHLDMAAMRRSASQLSAMSE